MTTAGEGRLGRSFAGNAQRELEQCSWGEEGLEAEHLGSYQPER